MQQRTTASTIQTEDLFQIPTYKKMPMALERGEGRYVWDQEGRRYLDFYGGHCVTILGHCPPRVVSAVSEQAGTLMFYSNVAYSPVRAEAAQALATLAPEGMGHLFFCNSGTEANETALKLARTSTGKAGVLGMEGGFHGRTLGSLATTWANKYRAPFRSVLPDTVFAPFGDLEAAAAAMERHGDIAAVILEPIQSMAGIQTAEASYFEGLRQLCDQHGASLIFDEVQTGVGRTGTFSIADTLGVKPDLITMAKSLGSGMPVGAVFVSDAIAEKVGYGDQGTTFGGGMLAMAAVKAVADTIVNDALMDRAPVIFERVKQGIEQLPGVVAVRGQGCLIGVELDGPAAPVLAALRDQGVIAGGAVPPNVIRLMPPLNTTDEEIDEFVTAFRSSVEGMKMKDEG
ncbi:MAG: aspartate aminotransferase family protein [Bacteroidota bacterium]